MKKIYIILTHTGTLLSKAVKHFTKYEFSHVSISLDVELNNMYSFGRLNPYNAFWAGFVHEEIKRGTFKRFFNTKAKIYYLEIDDEQYEKIENIIEEFKSHDKSYKFNILGLFAAGFHKKIGKEHSFYCAEFVKYVLDQAGIETKLPNIVKPEHFKSIEGIKEVYSGFLRRYSFSKRKVTNAIGKTALIYSSKKELI